MSHPASSPSTGAPVTELARGRFIRLVSRGSWEFVERVGSRGAVMVLAVTPADEVLLVEQYRPPLDARVVELPAGLVADASAGADDTEEAAVRREVAEETGYQVGRVWRLGGGPASPGTTAEVVPIYRADGLVRVHDGGGVEGEAIEVHHVPRREVAAWLAARERLGRLVDTRIYAALYLDAITPAPGGTRDERLASSGERIVTRDE